MDQIVSFFDVGIAPITNGMAKVKFDRLNCTIVYNIIAGGTRNGTLVGPRSSHGTITAGPCTINSVTAIAATGKCALHAYVRCVTYYKYNYTYLWWNVCIHT